MTNRILLHWTRTATRLAVFGGLAFVSAVFAQAPLPQPKVVFRGHTEMVYAAALSPDGKLAATGSFDKTIKLWDPATGKEFRTLAGKNGHQGQLLCLTFSPAGDVLASGGGDNVVKVWDVPSGTAGTLLAHTAGVTRVTATADAKTLAGAASDGSIKLWTAADSKAGPTLTGHTGAVTGLAFQPNGLTLVSAGADRTLRYWNPVTGLPLGAVGASPTPITGFVVNPANGIVATASADGSLRFWPATPPVALKPIAPLAAAATAFAVSADGTFGITGAADKTVRVVNLTTGVAVPAQQVTVPTDVKAVAVTSGGQAFAAGTSDGKLTIWGVDGKPRGSYLAHDGAVTALAVHPSQTQFLSAGADGVVRIWPIPAAAAVEVKPAVHPDMVKFAAVLSDGKKVVTGSADKIIRIVNAGAIEKPLPGHEAAVTAVAEAPGVLISGDAGGSLFTWVVATGVKTAVVPAGPKVAVSTIVPQPGTGGFAVVYATGEVQYRPIAVAKEKVKEQEPRSLPHPAPVIAAAFTADGKKLMTVCADKSLRSWDVATAKADPPVVLTTGIPKAAAFTADRTKLVLAHTDGAVNHLLLRTLADPKPVFDVVLPGEAEAIAISPTATRIAVAVTAPAPAGRSVRLFDAVSGQPLQIVAQPTAAVRGLAFQSDSKTIMVAGDDKQVSLFDTTTTAAIATGAGNTATVAINPAGQILTGGADKSAHLWDAATFKEVKPLGPLPAAITVAAFSRDGAVAVAASAKTLKLWTIADGKEIPFLALPADALALSFNADRTKLLVGMADNSAWVYDVPTGLPAQFAPHTGAVVGAAFHPSQPQFFTASADKTLTANNLIVTKVLSDPASIGAALAVPPNGSHYLTAGTAKGVALWNGAYAKERTLEVEAPITALAVSPTSLQVAAAHGADSQVSLLNFADGVAIGKFPSGGKVAELQFHPALPSLLGTLADGKVVAWNVAFEPAMPLPPEFGKTVQDFPHPTPTKSAFVYKTTDSSFVLTGSDDKQVRVWKFASDQPAKSLAHPNLIDAVAFDKTGTLLATGCHDGILRVWDVAKATATKTINAHTMPQPNPIYAVAWSPDMKQIVTASFDRSIKVWDAAAGTMVREIKPASDKIIEVAPGAAPPPVEPGHRDQVFSIAFDKTGKYLASGSSDRTVQLWDYATGKSVKIFANAALKPGGPGTPQPSHPGFVHAVRFTPDGTKLVTAGTAPRGQGYMAVWAVPTGALLGGFDLPYGPVYVAELTADGSAVLLGCGPKDRMHTEGDAVLLPLPVK